MALNDVGSLRTALQQQHTNVVEVDDSLTDTVGSLKEAMMVIIRRKKQEDLEYGDAITNGSH